MAKYGRHLRKIPMVASKVTGGGGLSAPATTGHVPLLWGTKWVGFAGPSVSAGPGPRLSSLAAAAVGGCGQVAEVLAGGYTLLIPKPVEEGPLGTRPLTVLSMIYPIWARTWVQDVLLWHGSTPRPMAFVCAGGLSTGLGARPFC